MSDPSQAEIGAWIETIDSKNVRLLLMWRDRTLKAEARIEVLEAALRDERERCIAVCESWIGTFQKFDPKRIGARSYAVDAIEDIIAVIRDGTDPRAALDPATLLRQETTQGTAPTGFAGHGKDAGK